jgi:mannitol/fructose-specific phosphotransferase system IIA component (Ntr-type)
MVHGKFDNPGDVLLEKQYKNFISQGQFIPHRISPDVNSKIQPYIQQLKITVNSLVGDADLFVSMTEPNPNNDNTNLKSRLVEPLD